MDTRAFKLDARETTPPNFLRSQCVGPFCIENGLEFHTRISPSPSRSRHSRPRRRRSGSSSNLGAPAKRLLDFDDIRGKNCDFESRRPKNVKKSAEERGEEEEETSCSSTLKTTMTTAGEKNSTTSTRKLISPLHNLLNPFMTSKRDKNPVTSQLEASKQGSLTMKAMMGSGSPRVKAFDGDDWIHSPRTGYTYLESPSYRETWTPDREIPMPHMARKPLASFQGSSIAARIDFSDEEEDFIKRRIFEKKPASATSGRLSSAILPIFSLISSLIRLFVYEIPAVITMADTFLLVREDTSSVTSYFGAFTKRLGHFLLFIPNFAYKSISVLASIALRLYKVTFSWIKGAFSPLSVPSRGEQQITEHIKKVTYRYHYIWNTVRSGKVARKVKKAKESLSNFLPIFFNSGSQQNFLPMFLLLVLPSLIVLCAPQEWTPFFGSVKSWVDLTSKGASHYASSLASFISNLVEVCLIFPGQLVANLVRSGLELSSVIPNALLQLPNDILKYSSDLIENLGPDLSGWFFNFISIPGVILDALFSLIRGVVSVIVPNVFGWMSSAISVPSSALNYSYNITSDAISSIRSGTFMVSNWLWCFVLAPGTIFNFIFTIVSDCGAWISSTVPEIPTINVSDWLLGILLLPGKVIFSVFGIINDLISWVPDLPTFDVLGWIFSLSTAPGIIICYITSFFGDCLQWVSSMTPDWPTLDFSGWFLSIISLPVNLLGCFYGRISDLACWFTSLLPNVTSWDISQSISEVMVVPGIAVKWLVDGVIWAFGSILHFSSHCLNLLQSFVQTGLNFLMDLCILLSPLAILESLGNALWFSIDCFTWTIWELITMFSTFFDLILVSVTSLVFSSQQESFTSPSHDPVSFEKPFVFQGSQFYSSEPFKQAVKSVISDEMGSIKVEVETMIADAKNDAYQKWSRDTRQMLAGQEIRFEEKLEKYQLELIEKLRLTEEASNKYMNQIVERHINANPNAKDLQAQLEDLAQKLASLETQTMLNLTHVKDCCNKTLALTFNDISKFVKENRELLGPFFTPSLFDDPEANAKLKSYLQDQILQPLLSKVRQEVRDSVTAAQIIKNNEHDVHRREFEEAVQGMIRSSLMHYDADKTGQFDYALESAGASVVNTRCTETYTRKTAAYTLFGIPLWYPFNNPRTAIQPGVQPGECWAVKGTQAFLVIQLSRDIVPTAFSVEHIPKSLSPDGKISSAPKDFEVYGLIHEQDKEPVLLGRFSYSQDGDPVQYFEADNPNHRKFSHVELVIKSNHGNPNYTCLYRFRVHGAPN